MNDNIYIDNHIISRNKRNNTVCGDYTIINRTLNYTDFILSDGLGSGLYANIAAIASASRLKELINQDITLTRAAEKVVELMKRAKTESIPFATFTVARIMRDGQFTVINYENPIPILINNGIIQSLDMRYYTFSEQIITESNGILNIKDSLIFMSDGITQAGLGILPGYGWGSNGLIKYIKNHLNRNNDIIQISEDILNEAYKLSGNVYADDTTMAILTARPSKILNILTGPPLSKERDNRFVSQFMNLSGKKVICGSSTSDMVARVTGIQLKDIQISSTFTQPPKYYMQGIDLVTEGAITLNQVFNILDEDSKSYDRNSCVSELAMLLKGADEINILMGLSRNKGHTDISFKQMGVLERKNIIPLISEKLKAMGKLINIIKM